MPADTPEAVKNAPSFIQRACLIKVTFGPWLITQSNSFLFDVARFPSRRPALVRSALPLQMLEVICALPACFRSASRKHSSFDESSCSQATGNQQDAMTGVYMDRCICGSLGSLIAFHFSSLFCQYGNRHMLAKNANNSRGPWIASCSKLVKITAPIFSGCVVVFVWLDYVLGSVESVFLSHTGFRVLLSRLKEQPDKAA